MALMSWWIGPDSSRREYDLDYLFYGNWPLRRMAYEYSFLLYYNEKPKWTWDPNGADGLGIYTVNGQNVNDGNPPDYGTANPYDAAHAGDVLATIGKGLVFFQGNVLQWNAAQLNKQWEGPAHEALQRILTGFDHWVGDALRVSYSANDPSGQGYDNPTYMIAQYQGAAQKEFARVDSHYRGEWEKQFHAEFDVLDGIQKNLWYWDFGWLFDHTEFRAELAKRPAIYDPLIDQVVLTPARNEFDANQNTASTNYEGLTTKYVSVPASPWFEPAPPPDDKNKNKNPTINVKFPDFKPPTYDPPKYDPPKFDPPQFDQPQFDQPQFDPPGSGGPDTSGLDSTGSGLDQPGSGGPSLSSPPGVGDSGSGMPPTGLSPLVPAGGPTGEQGQGRGLVTGPDGGTGFDLTRDGVPDLGLNGLPLAGGGLPPGSRLVTGPDGTKGVDLNGDGIANVGLDGRALTGGSLPPGSQLITGPDGRTGIDVTGDGIPDLGLDGHALPGGGLPPGSELVTGPDGTVGIDIDGDGIPDIGANGWALPGGSLPEGTHLVTGPDGTTGYDVTGDGTPDFGVDGEWLAGGSLFNHPDAPDVSSQVVSTPDGLRGSPGSATPSSLSVASGSTPMMPMMPPMGGMGGMGGGGGQNQNNERERQTWLLEEEQVWQGETAEPTAVLGRPSDEDEEPAPDEWEAPPKTRPARGRPTPGRPGQRPNPAGWPQQGRANR